MTNAVFDSVCFVMDNGETALRDRLNNLGLESLKKLFRRNAIDRTTNLRKKSLTEEELINKIVSVSVARAHKGDAFRDA